MNDAPGRETAVLASFVAESSWRGVPAPVRHEGKRLLLNWLGCALGGARDPTVDILVQTLAGFAGTDGATLIGRHGRFDAPNAAMVNAVAANILDFDDTHMPTVIHPSVPVASAVLALAETHPVPGARLLHAFILGVEAACRVGNAVTPGHYERGWHISSTCGVFGAAAGCTSLLGLNAQQTAQALGIAATQASGLTEMLGSMTKSYNLGHAAKNGLTAALLARAGFTSSTRALEAPRGFAQVLGESPKLSAITAELGTAWAVTEVACKPFPCGIVLHSAIDACLTLRTRHGLRAGDIERVEVRLSPLALTLAGKPAPSTGLEGKLSARHATAVALLFGAAGVREFTDAVVRDPAVIALREKITTQPDPALSNEATVVAITLVSGERFELALDHAIGSLARPMSDADLEAKFKALAADAYSECHSWDVIELAWMLDTLHDGSALARAMRPQPGIPTR